MSPDSLTRYLFAFSHLHTARGAPYPAATLHRAPHKAILLLAVLDLAAQGKLTQNFIALTPDLADLFLGYWKLVMPSDRQAQWAYPFFYLRSEGFWHLVPQAGKDDVLPAVREVNSMARLRELVIGARLDDELHALVCMEETRTTLRAALIEANFAEGVRPALVEQGNVNIAAHEYGMLLLEAAKVKEPVLLEPRPAVRSAGFRQAIVTAYDHRCVLCGVRIVTGDGSTVAIAAHIVPWSESHNDNPTNGLCLCRLCHWVFDEGLASVTTRYRVRLSRQLGALGNIAGHLLTLDGRPIFEPVSNVWNPDLDALAWHGKNVFEN